MTESPAAGYREREHTADWELEVWAPDLASLLEQAARGMYALSAVRLLPGPRRSLRVQLQAHDAESLLVSFLSELLYIGEQEALGFDHYEIMLNEFNLEAELGGAPLASQGKEIKAVTYHNLDVKSGPHGLEARVVFDV